MTCWNLDDVDDCSGTSAEKIDLIMDLKTKKIYTWASNTTPSTVFDGGDIIIGTVPANLDIGSLKGWLEKRNPELDALVDDEGLKIEFEKELIEAINFNEIKTTLSEAEIEIIEIMDKTTNGRLILTPAGFEKFGEGAQALQERGYVRVRLTEKMNEQDEIVTDQIIIELTKQGDKQFFINA